MPSRDNHVLMTLKLDRWAQEHRLRGFEIERELLSARRRDTVQPKTRTRRFSLGNLKMLWTSTA